MRGVCTISHLQPVYFFLAAFKEDISCETKRVLSITLAARTFCVVGGSAMPVL